MNKHWVGLVIVLSMAGCGGELSYKRGASVRDLEQAKRGCMSTGDEASYTACMKQQGWTIAALDDSELFAQASMTENTPQAQPKVSAVVSPEREHMEVEGASAPRKEPTDTPSTPTSSRAKPPQTAITPPPDESTPYKISSWWKFGGNPEVLKRDMTTCESQLGEAHKPDTKAQVYTRAFVVCMYQKGWKGLKANKT